MLKSFSSPGRKCPTLPRSEPHTTKPPIAGGLCQRLPLVGKFRLVDWAGIEREMQWLGATIPSLGFVVLD